MRLENSMTAARVDQDDEEEGRGSRGGEEGNREGWVSIFSKRRQVRIELTDGIDVESVSTAFWRSVEEESTHPGGLQLGRSIRVNQVRAQLVLVVSAVAVDAELVVHHV